MPPYRATKQAKATLYETRRSPARRRDTNASPRVLKYGSSRPTTVQQTAVAPVQEAPTAPRTEFEVISTHEELSRLSKALAVPSLTKDAEALASLGAFLAAGRRMPTQEIFLRHQDDQVDVNNDMTVHPFVRWNENRGLYDWADPHLVESMVEFYKDEGRMPMFDEVLPDEEAVEWLMRSRTNFRNWQKQRIMSGLSYS